VELQKATANFYEWDLDVYFEDLEYKTSKILWQISIIHENIDSISEIFNTITNMMTNTNIGILTVLTVIIWIMTMISWIYWMNISLPWQDNAYAFTFLICGMLVMALITVFVFKKKKWF
jgi:magnesium transporter